MRDHPALQAESALNTACTALWATLLKRVDFSSMSKEQKESVLAKRADFREKWCISGAVNAPQNSPRKSYFALKNVTIGHSCACMGKAGAVTPNHAQSFYRRTCIKHSTECPCALSPNCVHGHSGH
jgi:hypothetical protein